MSEPIEPRAPFDFDSAPCGVHSLDGDGVFLAINDTELRWLGYTRDEVVGRLRFVDLLTEEGRQTFARNFPRFKAQGHIEDLQFELRRRDGTTFPVLLNATALVDGEGRFVRSQSVLFDVTERARAHEAQARLVAIVASSQAAIIGATPDKVVTDWNPAAERLFGYSAEEAVGRPLPELWLPADDDVQRIDFARLAEKATTTQLETVRRHKDGSPVHVSVAVSPILGPDGVPRGFSLIVVDVSARKQAEDALAAKAAEARARQRELDQFFSLSVELMCVCAFDGRFQRLNAAWERVLGFTTDELCAAPFMSFVHPDDRQATTAAFEVVLRGGTLRRFENRYRRRDGSYRWLSWSCVGVPESGVVFASASDVTDRRHADEVIRAQADELRAQADELRAQQRLLEERNVEVERASRSKSEFLANMSHELRTPLNAVIGFSELVLEEASAVLSSTQVRHLETVHASGRQLLELINDILDLVKIEAGRLSLSLEPLTPIELVAEAAAQVEAAARKKRIQVTTTLRTSGAITGDRQRVRQVLLNLLSNAVKFTPEEGRVEVGADDEGGFVRFYVRDTGPGITATLRPHLFQPFVQGESPLVKRHEGTGLGLVISRNLVEQHGGTIRVDSVPGEGATFSFTIPRSSLDLDAPGLEVAPATSEPDPSCASGSGQPLVVVVDGDASSRKLMRTWLGDAGCAVIEATTSCEALALVESSGPQLVVLDVGLDGDDAFALLEALKSRESTRHVPVVIASPRDDDVRGLALGAVEFFHKPIDRRAFMRRLSELVSPGPPRGAHVVLLIDDDPDVGTLLRPVIEQAGFHLVTATTGGEGLERARHDRPAVIVVDILLPDVSGFEVVDALARDVHTRDVPVLVLTAADLTDAERRRLRSHARALAEKGEFTREALVATVTRVRAAPHPAVPSGPAVLVVDDHDLNRELAVTILERAGHRVLTASDGETGLEVARRERPALILLDLAMPRMDGFEAIRHLRAQRETAEIPVIAFTALAMKTDEERVRQAGFDGYLTKPLERAVAAFVHARRR